MAAQFYKINYKSDFVLTINSDAGWAVPFCIKFWTGMPSHGYFAGFDGENYVNCRVGETPTQLLVMFDDHHMPIGPLRMQIAYHTTIEEFPDRKFDEVTNPTNVTVDIDGTEYQVMLDFTGETGADIDFSMPSSGVMSVNGKIGYVTLNAEDVGAQPTIEDLATIRSGAAAGATAVQPAEMTAALATKQDTINDLATIRSGAAAGATAYQKPGTGIPASDLASGVQSSLQKADAAAPQSNTYTKGEVDTLIEGAISDIDVDDALSTTSENPVQNKVVTTALNGKQATISDLATIRSGAAAGATAVQPAALTPIENDIDAIEGKIPSAASASNQLADKAFVNSALADKADTSDIPTALSQLSQDSTHRVVTDAEKSTWNGKQNAIDDLATIRSGAAAGATAVQPAAMNTALAAKQDTLTFDNAPTANSNNPVKSGGVYQAIQDIDVSSQISGKEDKSNKVTSFSSPTDTQYPSAKLVNDQLATKQGTISDLSAIRSGASAGATAYQKPGTGIPSTDLASAVQTSLERADEDAVRPYNTQAPDGMGYLVLDKDATFASQVTDANTIYEIRYDYDLDGQTVTLPAGCVLKFNGGSVSNGVLSGMLLTSDGFIDLRSLGVVYNSSAAAASNTRALNILSGVTNEVKLKASGELWLGGGNSVQGVNVKYVNLDGSRNAIHIDGFSGFVVSDGVTIRNCRVLTETWSTAMTFFNVFVKVQNVTHSIDVLFENNYFSGSMRVITASGISNSGTSVCMNSVRIIKNVFEEITCGNSSNIVFNFDNSNFVNFEVRDNFVHNFYSQFISCTSTNGSEYVDYLTNFYAQKGRNYEIANNQVRNELSFLPWNTIASGLTYFTFFIAEYGICNYVGNTINNIIGGNTGHVTYDAYLSVDILNYCNNVVKNVINITGSQNEILKSKSGGDSKIRRYVGNKFVLDDISSDVGVDVTALEYFLVNTESLSEQFIFSENVIDFCTLTLKSGYRLYANQLIVRGNKINIAKAVTMPSGNTSPIFPLWTNGVHAIIKDNDINITSATSVAPSLFYTERTSCSVDVSGNKLTNMMLYSSNDNRDIAGKCYNNEVVFVDDAIAIISSVYLVTQWDSGIEFKNNKVKDTNNETYRSLTQRLQPYDVDVVSPTNHTFYACYRVVENCRYVVEITDVDGKVISLSEFIMVVQNSTYAITAYDSSGTLVENATARTNLYNFGGSGVMQQYYDRSLILLNMPETFHVKARIYYNDANLSLDPNRAEGTITGIVMNGQTKGTSGVVNLGTVITQHQSLAGKQDLLTFDSIPTANSNNPVKSSGVASALGTKANQDDVYTKVEVNNLIVPANTTIEVVNSLPASGTTNKIYRVAGSTSYSDYGWNGTQFVKLAEYGYALDAEPTNGSPNAVMSGGVFEKIDLAQYVEITPISLANRRVGSTITIDTSCTLYYCPASKGDVFKLNAVFTSNYLRVGFTTDVPASNIAAVDTKAFSVNEISGADYICTAQSNGYFCFSMVTSTITSFVLKAKNTAELSVTEQKLENEKISYSVINGMDTQDVVDNAYIRYSDGAKITAGAAYLYVMRYYPCQGVRKIKAILGNDTDTNCAIAFYNSNIDTSVSNIGTYMAQASVQSIKGCHEYETDVPIGAKYVCISNKGAALTYPSIVLYKDPSFGKTSIFGSNNQRPNSAEVNIGTTYFDTTLGKPIFFNGTAWVDALGNEV